MDAELVVRAQEGDPGAFAALATVTYGRMHRVAQNILSDIDRADDAAQQAVVEIWRKLPQLRDAGRFEAWSYRIVVNCCYAEARKAKRWLPGLEGDRDEDPGAAEAITSVVYRDQLERGFRSLPLDHRTVLVLHHYLGLPLREVADVLGYVRNDIDYGDIGIHVKEGGEPQVRNNTIDDANLRGIIIGSGSRPSVDGNRLCGNRIDIHIEADAEPVLGDNETC